MNVFITGGTGYVGSAAAERLIALGHAVFGLARSDESAARLRAIGVEPVRGDLADPASVAAAARAADGVVHAGTTKHPEVDGGAVEAMLKAIEGASKPFVFTSGTWVHGDSGGTALDESTALNPTPLVAWLPEAEERVIDAAEKSVRGVVLRVVMVYGRGGGIPAGFVKSAREKGAARYVGTGENRWPFVHVEDLAALYALALESAPSGSVWIASHGPAYRVREVAEAASRGAGADGRTVAWPLAEARTKLGAYADALALDQLASGKRARDLLGWKPHGVDVIEDLESGSYVSVRPSPSP